MSSRRKGLEGEDGWVDYTGGTRISRPGVSGPDVVGPDGTIYEVKVGKQVPDKIYEFYQQAADEGAEAVAIKGHYKRRWLVVIDAKEFFNKWERKP